MSLSQAVINAEADIYDDGYLRVEHANYYLTCGGQMLKSPAQRVSHHLAHGAQHRTPRPYQKKFGVMPLGDSVPFNAQSLHVHIYRLRRRLSPFGLQIETKVCVGYCLIRL
jgi:hypothetical protein